MKSIVKAFVIGSLVLATQAAWSSPLGWGDGGSGSIIPTQSTYAEEHGGSQATVSGDFPAGSYEPRVKAEPPVRDTYRAEHAGKQSAVSGDFPASADQIRVKAEPPVHGTYQGERAGTSSAY